jgi:hypothetical protein
MNGSKTPVGPAPAGFSFERMIREDARVAAA